jgi:glycosyltransferase involved in cell wall biosynthesis
MKVLVFSHTFWPAVGGVETYVKSLASGFAETEGVEVTVATDTAGSGGEDPFGFRVVRKPGITELWRWIGWADVVQLAGPSFAALALALLRGKPVVIEQHGYQAVCPNGLLLHQPTQTICPQRFQRGQYAECWRCNRDVMGGFESLIKLIGTWPRRWLCEKATNLCITDHVRDRLDLGRSVTCYYGVEWCEAGLPGRAHEGPIEFAYVGRLTEEKGLPLLLQAAADLGREQMPFRLAFIGDGLMRSRLEDEIKTLGISPGIVEITGFLEGERFRERLSRVDVVVMPSIWEETAGLSAMEQMMRGRAVIAADVGGLGEVVGDGGLTFTVGEASRLADLMRKLIGDPRLVAEVGRRGRSRALRLFGFDRMITDHLALYRGLMRT